MKFGYARVSSQEQNLDRQIEAIQKFGVNVIYEEKQSGKNMDRTELQELLDVLQQDDWIVIESISRLGRSQKDLFRIYDMLEEKKVTLFSLKEGMLTGDSAIAKLTRSIFSALAEFEREQMLERQAEGIKLAKGKGIRFGRKPVSKAKMDLAIKLWESKEYTIKELEAATGVPKSSLYREIKKRSY